ncbi:MAG: Cof-type HAD-IIB family hydrolase [Levilactobacillus sp.]|jgi:Cof subfamily protein (haloacid dehalogenase superfamily)|uniref:Cof-type HAD-IIB family hydrolase n=1 Tax=Levilactobacillus sp. TaxID=2767919 RepID=UPI00258EB85A|nr:Cof-type HAD-IIB family hydrolase [Levilactobacillus sp.]MCH4124208.1 Cof-type HAD-IIB family hydrolase [Levilactobacillus sp.]MCI1554507.1 Cof-type HAD-IIB family hydrolase [Levilactobacillus sp.]MCI1598348.1 Cof-type HAD-IIB family hydrolase [Levilactobacillus sp.]MCI1606430.1 Cof-type HAD-IIB family hydrolase [Levilactobacillus sp.]
MTVKLIAIDIDGTLLTSNHKLALSTIDAIKAATASGIKVVLCSGRPLAGVRPYLEMLDLIGDDQYVIAHNGAAVQTTTGQPLITHSLSLNDAQRLVDLADQAPIHYHLITPQAIYTPNRPASAYSIRESHLVNLPIKYLPADQIPDGEDLLTFVFIDETAVVDQFDTTIPAALRQQFYVVHTDPHFIEVLNRHVSKAQALQELAQRLAIDPTDVMAIGDGPNDLPMLQAAGLGVAMGNADAEVQAAADAVTASNDADGVASAILTHALSL